MLVVRDLTEVEGVSAQTEGNIVRLTGDRNIIVRTAIDTDNSHAVIGEAITCIEGELNILSITWLKDATDWQDVEDFIDWKMLLLLFLTRSMKSVYTLSTLETF